MKFIKLSLVLIFVVILSGKQAIAQPFEGGFSGGVNAAWLSNIAQKGYQLWSFQGGVFSQVQMKNSSYLRAELRYALKGNHVVENQDGDYTIHLNYVDFPIAYSRYLNGSGILTKVYFIGGLSLNYLFKVREGFGNRKDIPEIEGLFNNFDLAGHAGFGFDFGGNLFTEFKYSISLFPIREHIYGNRFVLGEQRNNVLSLNFYYRI